jgi:uncharacterized protein (TIGR00251 family)
VTDPPKRRESASKSDSPWMRITAGEIVLDIIAQPRSSRRGVVRAGPQGLAIAINSAPDKGKANDELIEYLADVLRVPQAALMIVRGATSRKKSIRIITHETAKVAARLRRISNPE